MVVNAMVSSCRNEDHIQLLIKWFKEEKICNSAGKVLDINVTTGLKHSFIKRIWCSNKVTLEEKQALLDDLQKLDNSDRFEKTQKFCEAAHPANKQKMWDFYFSSDKELEKWGLHNYQQSFLGFSQIMHRDHISKFADDFFLKISDVIKHKGRFIASAYFSLLKPDIASDDASIAKFSTLLAKVEKEDPDNVFFINNLKSTISDLKTMQRGRECSLKYLAIPKTGNDLMEKM